LPGYPASVKTLLALPLARLMFLIALCGLAGTSARADTLSKDEVAALLEPPYQIGEPIEGGGWEIVNLDGKHAGFVFETEPRAPLPGFSGAPINVLVTLDLEGRFIDAELISHNEPIFVSGLGHAPFHEFIAQYRGLSIADTLVVGVPYGDKGAGSSLVYLDGVTKATASVRIAHESILAASFAIVKDRMQGVATGPPAYPNPDHREDLTWDDLVAEGIATRRLVTNAEVDAAFAGSLWEDDDAEARADPEGTYLDLWVIDVGPPSVAAAVLDAETQAELAQFMSISTFDEPVLVIDAGRHGLVGPDFVRNTSPDLMSASQDGFPLAFRDADLFVTLKDGVPGYTAMILRSDRRLGFDPTRDWTLTIRAVREHGSFRPEIGAVDFTVTHASDERFFLRDTPPEPEAPWQAAIRARQADMGILALGLTAVVGVLAFGTNRLAGWRWFTPARLVFLAAMIGFVGWWGQGQLSIVTVLGVIRGVWEGQSLAFLLYDPFSLLIWATAIVAFVAWGRGLFCGWLCPFGAMQEFAHHIGKWIGLRQITVPQHWDARLKWVKYVVLAGLVFAAFASPSATDKLVEVEPFKTAITVYFVREWYYVAYAAFWLLAGMVVFKGFCRYVCPLGAVMAIGGMLRGRDWIERRAECGSPCQLCKVRCKYNAIAPRGKVQYSECFQCLDCVTIHDDPNTCVPLVLAAKRRVTP